jgi:hypothetical protein
MVQYLDELRRRITAACETVAQVTLQNTWREAEYCLDIFWGAKGIHMKIY